MHGNGYGSRMRLGEVRAEEGEGALVTRIAHNTFLVVKDGKEMVRFHNTYVAVRNGDGGVTLNTDGWFTSTTRERLNDALRLFGIKAGVSQERRVWYFTFHVDGRYWNGPDFRFTDGMKVWPDGRVEGAQPKDEGMQERKAMERRIRRFLRAAKDYFEKSGVPQPEGGDCFYCQWHEKETGKSFGDAVKNTDHLLMHMEEMYIPGSLIYNAYKDKGYGDPYLVMLMDSERNYLTRVIETLGKYLRKRLLAPNL